MERRNIIILVASAVVVLLVGWFALKHFGVLNKNDVPAEGWNREQAEVVMRQLCRAADSVGIDTNRYSFQVNDTKKEFGEKFTGLLLELRYGLKPSRITYTKLPEKIDTVWAIAMLKKDEGRSALDSLKKTSVFGHYTTLVNHYTRLRKAGVYDTAKYVRQTLNFYRYLNRFEFDRFLVVNIPAAQLNIYDRSGKCLLPMDVIAGKRDSKTPFFTTYLTDIITYPYWNVPRGIGIKEILPKVQANVQYLENQNMEVLDAKEQVVDPYEIDWASLSAENFPYRFRQASGCSNSLGLIKFNLTGPGAIYLHDTNARDLFDQTSDRWRSHGCMRVQKPVELANYLMEKPVLDEGFMNRCMVDQKPQTLKLPKPFPVFVVYNRVDVDESGNLRGYKDVYGLDGGRPI
ncbi:L,D-transpeptidase family protein [Larkinella insperata]|uniref:L,D-transpeptidase family protein n=1 Tax=Larkinella insperata TaxID=332158 RepID=A0ABW3Q903_9BACT|nr:L,D-transpeptidase family protein [Larkinella insperata]